MRRLPKRPPCGRPLARRADRSGAARARGAGIARGSTSLLWTIYGTIAKGSQGLHPDMTELIAWSRDLASAISSIRRWRPGCRAALVHRVSGRRMVLLPAGDADAGVALWIVWRLSADYLDAEKRVVGLALLTLVPFFNFHALKFNVNTVLMPLWAATTGGSCARTRRAASLYAVLAGIGAAALHAGQILVGVSARGSCARRADRPAPRRLFPLGRALDHHRSPAWSCWRRI